MQGLPQGEFLSPSRDGFVTKERAERLCPNVTENILNLGPQQEFEVRALSGKDKPCIPAVQLCCQNQGTSL